MSIGSMRRLSAGGRLARPEPTKSEFLPRCLNRRERWLPHNPRAIVPLARAGLEIAITPAQAYPFDRAGGSARAAPRHRTASRRARGSIRLWPRRQIYVRLPAIGRIQATPKAGGL